MHNICNVTKITYDLKIPDKHIDDFLYFVTEDKEVIIWLNEKNESRAKFRITELALKYLELIKE